MPCVATSEYAASDAKSEQSPRWRPRSRIDNFFVSTSIAIGWLQSKVAGEEYSAERVSYVLEGCGRDVDGRTSTRPSTAISSWRHMKIAATVWRYTELASICWQRHVCSRGYRHSAVSMLRPWSLVPSSVVCCRIPDISRGDLRPAIIVEQDFTAV